ncbi:protein phosphatase 2C domain-containing protein [Gemelliphila palaticanis]|uniref:Serine/threonine-protein phosphatase n=1 Tax=Gemelliphila palaticanis TaxID=81950 RepID=A0ABX2SZ59_9BACL|nr:protein phosphatase 2C domain-containing protein [Gemella palaticanis]MBF0715731.1 serine/threonine-protein phosphatase [Gemella palaticanis]NYS47661.1 serine/threonine-protein phosphatase [Gemella palaticanis]
MPIVYSFNNSKGIKKEKNQDAVNVIKNKNGALLGIICDGVSSHSKSEYSSNYIVNYFSKKWKKTKFDNVDNVQEWLFNNVNTVNLDIIKKSVEENEKMATTIVVTVIFDNNIVVANVGDSFTYSIDNNDNVKLITKDDSYPGVLLEAGAITEEEAMNHPEKNKLTQAIGVKEVIDIHIGKYDLNDYKYILSCSDGLTTMLSIDDIYNIISNNDLSSSIKVLIDEANNRGGLDNISIILFKIMRGVEYDR